MSRNTTVLPWNHFQQCGIIVQNKQTNKQRKRRKHIISTQSVIPAVTKDLPELNLKTQQALQLHKYTDYRQACSNIEGEAGAKGGGGGGGGGGGLWLELINCIQQQ